jgi:N-methylhydantoinase B
LPGRPSNPEAIACDADLEGVRALPGRPSNPELEGHLQGFVMKQARPRIELQVLGSSLCSIAEEMGAILIRSAFSANIKERRDCSTALFDESGRMIAQAEHIPVHLGALPDAVAAVREHDPAPDDVFILNDPYAGGTHLPDITLVSRTAVGFAATRAHHADVGAAEPGSLPAGSRRLDEEGVVIPPTRLDDATLNALTTRMRNPDERRGDLRAQLAASLLATHRIEELCARRGRDLVAAAMGELHDYAERRVRAAIAALPDGRYEASDVLEAEAGELELHAKVTIEGDELEIDFAGTAPQHDGNLNCPLAVTRSACYFVVRCLTDPDAPASGGAFAPVSVRAPEGSLVNARPPAAVAAGNVETSSRIADVVFLAFGQAIEVPAQGQGTMNNVTLGNDGFTYYETIGGGQGACPNADGPSAVHVAMSNTLSTPTEALELAYPLRVERHALRLGSGGAGSHRGGDGVIRELRALKRCRLSILSERRARAPRGRDGGEPGEPGRNLLNGEELPSKTNRDLEPGDVLKIETPGGGGYGSPGLSSS